ncbi:MAG: hypothetical protein J2P17_15165 [Mycobacterium sp.]|nr:hypothetical protein [Mycobacterium sp.]
MLLLTGEEFDERIRACESEAFHLELQDEYGTTDGIAPFAAWQRGESDDYAWFTGWLELIRDMRGRGVAVKRARVVTVPHTLYTRWLLEVTEQNIRAGEDIRYLPRDQVDPTRLTTDDWWLFDDHTVAFTAFAADGTLGGGAITTDPLIVARCRQVRDYTWDLGVPYPEYLHGVR